MLWRVGEDMKAYERTLDALRRAFADTAHDDLALEGTENDKAELGFGEVTVSYLSWRWAMPNGHN